MTLIKIPWVVTPLTCINQWKWS